MKMRPRVSERFRRFPFVNYKSPDNKTCGISSYEDYAKRIQKTLYYGKLPSTDRPSLPVTDILVGKFGKFCKSDGIEQLKIHEASSICYDACVTPCSVIVALLYLDRLRNQNPEYLASTSPSQVFVVSLMVASKYLYDDGEEDEVYNHEWASSAAMMLSDLNEAEKLFLSAIDWNLFVDMKAFMDGLLVVESAVARQQGTSRGYFIYSDLTTILNTLPSAWSSCIHLIGSAIVICIISYTTTVFIVVAGTLATKQLGLQIVNQGFQNESEPVSLSQINNSCCSHARGFCDETIEKNPLEENNLLFEEETDDHLESTSQLRKFNALQTLTTALLLASSKFLETPVSDFSSKDFIDPYGNIKNSSAFSVWEPGPDMRRNIVSVPDQTLERTYCEDQEFTLSSSLVNGTSSRRWRKSYARALNGRSLPFGSSEDFQSNGIMETEILDIDPTPEDQFDYFRMVIDAEDDVIHSRLSYEVPPLDLSHPENSSCSNATSFISFTYPPRFFLSSDHNYFDEKINFVNYPISILSSVFPPFQFLLKIPDEVGIEWKPEGFGLTT